MREIQIIYALRHIKSKQLVRYCVHSNDNGKFCGETRVELYHSEHDNINNIWYEDEAWKAEYVRNFSTPWYNSGLENPQHGYEPEELEIVKITRDITTEGIKAKVPTLDEYFKVKYKKIKPEHYAYLKRERERIPSGSWSNYMKSELEELIREGLWNPGEDGEKTNDKKSNPEG